MLRSAGLQPHSAEHHAQLEALYLALQALMQQGGGPPFSSAPPAGFGFRVQDLGLQLPIGTAGVGFDAPGGMHPAAVGLGSGGEAQAMGMGQDLRWLRQNGSAVSEKLKKGAGID